MTTEEGSSNKEDGRWVRCEQKERKVSERKRGVGVERGTLQKMGQVQGELGQDEREQSCTVGWGCGATEWRQCNYVITLCTLWSAVSCFHSCSSWGKPYQWTRYLIWLWQWCKSRIALTPCSSASLMRSGGGGGGAFREVMALGIYVSCCYNSFPLSFSSLDCTLSSSTYLER